MIAISTTINVYTNETSQSSTREASQCEWCKKLFKSASWDTQIQSSRNVSQINPPSGAEVMKYLKHS